MTHRKLHFFVLRQQTFLFDAVDVEGRNIFKILFRYDSSIGAAAKLLLQALAMLPDAALTGDGIDATYGGDYFYINNAEAERCLFRGGGWDYGGGAGVFDSGLHSPRSRADGTVGGRSAFYE